MTVGRSVCVSGKAAAAATWSRQDRTDDDKN